MDENQTELQFYSSAKAELVARVGLQFDAHFPLSSN